MINLIEEKSNKYREAAEAKGLQFSFQHLNEMPDQIVNDPKIIGTVVANLIENAVRFTAKGAIAVTLSAKQLSADQYRFQVDVSDTGIGIPEKETKRIFDSFTQIDSSLTRQYDGNGLGLSVCEKFAKSLGGTISVSSEVGMGSTFTFVFDSEIVLDIAVQKTKFSTN